ncbi:P-type conjugative transfer protein TrbG [Vibrio alginolyticus]|uniref:P-type conjugative transfer protein TrbG n=1 Tax=Vibrio TaxID=662 RepID=UPI00186AA4AA|nr:MULTISPECIES: P-type conjugative transfer protein TrbG [Vibrio]MBE4026199.1 P-type conjugative transfer protein TrbG [Vibrio parahaemolyticus]MCA2452739.1 P-type conjugative transfer protein TrbG [Vibrio alginolyticus]MCG6307753.1 P-type conjugative transfer protein TrbG [Vibrio alginolyticus]MDW2232741.1 P-type conjugative transfer protein TrbG [Vibrio sp. 2091]
MNKQLSAVILGTALLVPSLANIANANGLEDKYFSNNNPTLTQQERQALAIAKKWQAGNGNGGIRPFSGRNGSIQYVFGAQSPSVVCAVLQVCDIALQPGEYVNSIQLGDTARWNVEPAISGTGAAETQHLLIKPLDVGLETSLVVTTDRRVYHIRLRSHRKEYMPQVSFTYPEDALAKWETIRTRERQHREDNTIPSTREYLGDLSFDYQVSGSAAWKPVRVFNDGHKTIIQMPKAMQQADAPTLLVVRNDGGWFSDAETEMVNYRVQGDRYIVDTVFKKAILISGVGSRQDKITITKEGK